MDDARLDPTNDPNSPDQAVSAPEPMDDPSNADEKQPKESVATTENEELYHSADEEDALPKAGSSGHAYSEEHSPADSDTRIRRSTRDIKRPKFDDELVDSGSRSHTRRLSERSSSSFSNSDEPRPAPMPSAVALSIDTNLASVLDTGACVSAEPSPMTPFDESLAAWAIEKGERHSSDGSTSAAKRHDLRQRTHMISVKDRMAMDDAIQEEEAARMERKRRESRIASKDIRAKEIAAAHEAAEALSLELNDWTAEDDIALVTAITHIGDMEAVHRGCRFSRDYGTEEMEERWYQLMYDEALSRQAKKRMQELHPELVLKIQSKTPFSVREEEILREIEPAQNPCLELMGELIKDHPEEFHSARTPQILLDHWHMMLRHQVLTKAPPTSVPAQFERVERNSALCGANPMKAAADLRLLNNRLAKVGVQPVAGIVTDAQLGPGAVATLIGKVVRFVLRREHLPVLLGRNTSEISADVNLSLEGPAAKISRKQAQITMESNGELWMRNLSPASCIVDGKKLDEGQKTRLNNNTMIEFGIIKLTFRLVNNPSTIPKAQV